MILFLTNNKIGFPVFTWLAKQEDTICFAGKLDIAFLKKILPHYIISYNYKFIIPQAIIQLMSGNIINLHVSMLPWNKGAHPNFWAFFENTPHGVTIHRIDEGLDTGDIYVQKEIFFNPAEETFSSSYKKLHENMQALFIDNWEGIKCGAVLPISQRGVGSFHKSKELDAINEIVPLDWNCNIQEYLDKYRRALHVYHLPHR